MTNEKSQVHFTTPAEAILMEAIDHVITNHQAGEVQPLIDFDFLRDYTVAQLRLHFKQQGVGRYTTYACACVCASRYYYRNRKVAMQKFIKNTHRGKFATLGE